jgi:hypothetical protein
MLSLPPLHLHSITVLVTVATVLVQHLLPYPYQMDKLVMLFFNVVNDESVNNTIQEKKI